MSINFFKHILSRMIKISLWENEVVPDVYNIWNYI